ncbi:STAS domain-containing protein [Saccharothrix violaceirubra]|uniref:Anti-anti-sigma factor n=1 Tax=Saccharothrix violaceirubra TaxID=413306 RepID=A0A7W7T3R0_9PSEU|nr:STAS domain-containing protein [Saccharothrix violaceirubra]MBB4966013.1 anti-anti-sigma factor [Saccharothrix violaceirubra]
MIGSAALTLTTTFALATVHVVLAGDLAYDTADALLGEVTTALGADGVREVRLDCADVTFCDSYGLATLLMVHRRVTEADLVLHLENRPAPIARLLLRTNTHPHFASPPVRVVDN